MRWVSVELQNGECLWITRVCKRLISKLPVRHKLALRGLLTCMPLLSNLSAVDAEDDAYSPREFYSIWLRHLVVAREFGLIAVPSILAEVGPGQSYGVGIAALVSGVQRYIAFNPWPSTRKLLNLKLFDAIVDLFHRQEDIPQEYERMIPRLKSYRFPLHIVGDAVLADAKTPERLTALRKEISTGIQKCLDDGFISNVREWMDPQSVVPCSVDLICSQAVLEHIDDLKAAYQAMWLWLKPGGMMTHAVDFKSHSTSGAWNGHWTYSDMQWALMRGCRKYFLNREPLSRHRELLIAAGFEIVGEMEYVNHGGIDRSELTSRFVNLSDKDLTTSEVMFVARKPNT